MSTDRENRGRARRRTSATAALTTLVCGATLSSARAAGVEPPATDPVAEVRAAEIAFAQSMADRDLVAFSQHVAEDAVFLDTDSVLRGRAAVTAGWAGLFEAPQAPFSWKPEQVEVLESGTLALSTGPVFDARGQRIGTFISTWRRDADGEWRVVFDKGCPPCKAPSAD